MKRSTISLAVLALAGCGSFGHTAYEVKASTSGKGCDLSAQDGKEFKGRNFAFDGKGCTLIVEEGASKAFAGQAIGAKAMTVLPVTGLQDLVKP
jgi:hypothetical protein